MSGLENFKEDLASKEKFNSLLTDKKLVREGIKVWDRFEIKTMKRQLVLKMWCCQLICFQNLEMVV